MERRGVGFAFANTPPFATTFFGLFPSPSLPNFPCCSRTGPARSIENSFLFLSPGLVFHFRWWFQSERHESHEKD